MKIVLLPKNHISKIRTPMSVKNLLLLLITFSFSGLSLQAQNANDSYSHTIHIGAFVKTQLSDFNTLRPLGYLYAEQFDNSLLRVYMGKYQSEASARTVLQNVKRSGYPDAYVTRKPLTTGASKTVIQLATLPVTDVIQWDDYEGTGSLSVELSDRQVKVMSGPYASRAAAQSYLTAIRQKGFSDAFIKKADTGTLLSVTEFQVGNIDTSIEPAKEDVLVAREAPAPKGKEASVSLVKAVETKAVPTTKKKEVVPPPAEAIPDNYDAVMTIKAPPANIAAPTIRKDVKRNSAYMLQILLKSEGVYSNSLDGYYGKGTTAGYEKLLETNAQLRKYKLLTSYVSPVSSDANASQLQDAMNQLLADTPDALSTLEKSKTATAAAYQAYYAFMTRGASDQVDNLMNAAIKKAFAKSDRTFPKFNPDATYAYKSTDQLVQHLQYIQTAAADNVDLPCWMVNKHPDATFDALMGEIEGLGLQQCDDTWSWEELQLLNTIAADLNPSGTIDPKVLRTNAAHRSAMMLAPEALPAEEGKMLEDWHTALWKGLDKWSEEEGLHQKLAIPLKATYFQSLVRLEDYFMGNDLKPKEARQAALAVLKSMVDPHLSSYSAS